MIEPNFIDEMLLEIEAKEEQLQLAHVDIVLKEISFLNSEIAKILSQAEEEKQIIQEWAIQRSDKLNNRVEWLSKKLEMFMNEQDPSIRTLDLANGILSRRKQTLKVVLENLDQFLQNENLSQLTTVTPEVVKPDLNKIKAYFKMTGGKIPLGCNVIKDSSDKFSIKLKQNGELKNGTKED